MSHESDDSWWFTTYNCSWTIGHRLRFCLANTLCNGSTWFDLLVHIWNIIDEPWWWTMESSLAVSFRQLGNYNLTETEITCLQENYKSMVWLALV